MSSSRWNIRITRIGFSNGLDDGSNGGDNFGGGIDAFTAELHLSEVEISGCQAVSGAGLSLANANGVIGHSAITANIAAAQGGGIYFQGDNNRLFLHDSTIGSNAANGSGLGGGHRPCRRQRGHQPQPARHRFQHPRRQCRFGRRRHPHRLAQRHVEHHDPPDTLLANNTGGHLVQVAGTGTSTVSSRCDNLADTVEPLLNQASDRTNVNPQLGILQNNGGNSRSYALLPGSAAIDAGIRAGSVIDQRGSAFVRPLELLIANAAGGDGSDIGAFEVPNTVLSILRASANPTPPGSTVSFTVSFNASVLGADASDFALSTSGVSGAAITAVSGSGSSRTVSVNVGTGSGSVPLISSTTTASSPALDNQPGPATRWRGCRQWQFHHRRGVHRGCAAGDRVLPQRFRVTRPGPRGPALRLSRASDRPPRRRAGGHGLGFLRQRFEGPALLQHRAEQASTRTSKRLRLKAAQTAGSLSLLIIRKRVLASAASTPEPADVTVLTGLRSGLQQASSRLAASN